MVMMVTWAVVEGMLHTCLPVPCPLTPPLLAGRHPSRPQASKHLLREYRRGQAWGLWPGCASPCCDGTAAAPAAKLAVIAVVCQHNEAVYCRPSSKPLHVCFALVDQHQYMLPCTASDVDTHMLSPPVVCVCAAKFQAQQASQAGLDADMSGGGAEVSGSGSPRLTAQQRLSSLGGIAAMSAAAPSDLTGVCGTGFYISVSVLEPRAGCHNLHAMFSALRVSCTCSLVITALFCLAPCMQ